MYRFYCVVCKKVKRVQQVPNICSQMFATNPENRIGECNFHKGIKILNIGREKFRNDILDNNDKPHHVRFKYRNARNQSAPKVQKVETKGKGKK